jgi:hypothetical protein
LENNTHTQVFVEGGKNFFAHLVSLQFFFVSKLQQGLQKFPAPIPHFVNEQVGDVKVGEASLFHEPPQVRGGNSFLGMEGAAV